MTLALPFVQGVYCCNPAIASGNHCSGQSFQTFKITRFRAQAIPVVPQECSCGARQEEQQDFRANKIAKAMNSISFWNSMESSYIELDQMDIHSCFTPVSCDSHNESFLMFDA